MWHAIPSTPVQRLCAHAAVVCGMRYLAIQLRALCEHPHLPRHGNIPRAWRRELDQDQNGRICRSEFFIALRGMAYGGNALVSRCFYVGVSRVSQ